MLCLARKPGERIVINGNIIIEVSRKCVVKIEAPKDIPIVREELIKK